jgi:DNA-binding beta-propeller fold protein YncE
MHLKAAIHLSVAALATGCAMGPEREVEGQPRKETIVAVTEGGTLVRFNAGQPQKVAVIGAVKGLQPGENLMGIDFRVNRGVLYGLGSTGRIYTIDAKTAEAKAVGPARLAIPLSGGEFGFDFNPAVDRIRIVSGSGQNMRAHPDTGASVDGNPQQDGVQPDGALAYAAGDRNAGKTPRVVGAAYTYNKQNEKITTNYAIDAETGALVMQGSKEGATPAVSPNTGQLFTVGSLGVAPFARASFDIADVSNAAFASINHGDVPRSRFYEVDLATGKATFIGTVGGGESLRGIAFEP